MQRAVEVDENSLLSVTTVVVDTLHAYCVTHFNTSSSSVGDPFAVVTILGSRPGEQATVLGKTEV